MDDNPTKVRTELIVVPPARSLEAITGPRRVIMTPGQDGDNPQLLPLLDGIRVARSGPGRPRSRPEAVLADKAYSHPSTRQALRKRQIRLVSPERTDQIARRKAAGSHGGRPPAFDTELYKQRNVVPRVYLGAWPEPSTCAIRQISRYVMSSVGHSGADAAAGTAH
jgi:transposase